MRDIRTIGKPYNQSIFLGGKTKYPKYSSINRDGYKITARLAGFTPKQRRRLRGRVSIKGNGIKCSIGSYFYKDLPHMKAVGFDYDRYVEDDLVRKLSDKYDAEINISFIRELVGEVLLPYKD